MTEDRARYLVSLMDHPGWPHLLALRDEAMAECWEYLESALESAPEKLTTKTAIAKANRRKALRDFFDEVSRARTILTAPNRKAGS